jgi:hypothetical protein
MYRRTHTLLAFLLAAAIVALPAAAQTTQPLPGPTLAAEGSQGEAQRSVKVTGTLTDEGVECPALRGDDGQLYTLTGDLEGFSVGDHVRVVGKVAERTFCGQGTTLEVQNIKRA